MLFISYSTLLIKNENRAKNKLVKEFQTFRESYSLDHFQDCLLYTSDAADDRYVV